MIDDGDVGDAAAAADVDVVDQSGQRSAEARVFRSFTYINEGRNLKS